MPLEPQAAAATARSAQAVRNQTGTRMRVAQGDGKGIGRIDLRLLVSLSRCMTIIITCSLLAPPVPATACLTGLRCILQFPAPLRHPPRWLRPRPAQLQCRIGVTRHENLFDAHRHWFVGLDDFPHTAINDLQTLMQLAAAGADAARRDIDTAAPGVAYHAIAGDSRTGIDTKNKSHNACSLRKSRKTIGAA